MRCPTKARRCWRSSGTSCTAKLAPRTPCPPAELDEAIAYWLALPGREEGRIQTGAGQAQYVALPFTEGDQHGLFVAANFPAFERSEIDAAVRTQAITQFVTILVASLIGFALAGRVLRPLRSLADTAQRISETDLTRRIPVRGDDEASRIATAFNDMLSRLEAAFATQRQFLDDASHELRVPLTVVRGNVEILELEPDAEERAAMVTVITNEIERMNRIVEDLLLLARAERPGFLAVEPVDLFELTTNIHRKASVLCARDWQLEHAAHAVIVADEQRLIQAMLQLAQNACQHTDAGSPVRIGSRLDNGDVVLWVHDSGHGCTRRRGGACVPALREGFGSSGGERARPRAVDRGRHRHRPRRARPSRPQRAGGTVRDQDAGHARRPTTDRRPRTGDLELIS